MSPLRGIFLTPGFHTGNEFGLKLSKRFVLTHRNLHMMIVIWLIMGVPR